jgi:hypothetical protein
LILRRRRRKINLLIDVIISDDDNSNSKELLRIPLLKDVFERYPTIPINIDIKENNDELIKQVKHIRDFQNIELKFEFSGIRSDSTVSPRTYHILG